VRRRASSMGAPAYCFDMVDQGIGYLEDLAAKQVRSPSWYFWWD